MNHHPRIKAFSIFPPGTPFRIDWFGNVAYSRDINHSQPFIAISLSEIPAASRDSWTYPTSFDGRLHQRHVFVPVGFLPYLRIGDIWTRDGFVRSPDYVQKSFCIKINREDAKLLKAGAGEGEHSGFFLPFETHPYHSEHTHSYCVKVALGSDAYLVIPSIELIRFYFGSSSKLVSMLFSVPFQEENLWVDAKKDEHGIAHIGLASGISGYSATDVARIAFNGVARRAAKLAGDSCVTASTAKERAYPKMFFPFAGETTLNAAGVWLQTEENGMKVFLAFRLLSCAHPFPFSKLCYTMERSPIKTGGTPTSGKSAGTAAQPVHGSRKEGRKPLDEHAPSQGLAHKEIHLWNTPRFPDLTSKHVSRVDPESPGTVVSFGEHAQVESWSVGEGVSEKGRRPVDLIDAPYASDIVSHPLSGTRYAEILSAIVDNLMARFPSVQYIPLTARQRYPQFSVMPRLVNEDGEIHPLCFITKGGQSRSRYVSVIRVANEGGEELAVFPEFVEEDGHCLESATLFLMKTNGSWPDADFLLEIIGRMVWGHNPETYRSTVVAGNQHPTKISNLLLEGKT